MLKLTITLRIVGSVVKRQIMRIEKGPMTVHLIAVEAQNDC